MRLNRDQMLDKLTSHTRPWDLLIIGGGATGMGIAVDAAARGYATALVEQVDFGKGTSSRSTKLVHGGVRYLQQGNIGLVMEALRERGRLRANAPHLVHDLKFIVPNYDWWEAPFYGAGLKIYDLLAGRYGFGPSRLLSSQTTLERIPTIRTDGLRGGVQYYDGQFDDARLLITLAQTAARESAALLNYAKADRLIKRNNGQIEGAVITDQETGREHEIRARVVVNATGPFADGVRRMDEPDADPMIAPSQGIHLVLPIEFLPSDHAIMVPHTSDGRVMFAIPWHHHVVVGTTDTSIEQATLEPLPEKQEIEFILETAGRYLKKAPAREDVLSVFTGIRPLVRADHDKKTAALSREHVIHVAESGLVTIAGGKWTTYRKMAEDCVDHVAEIGGLDEVGCPTKQFKLHGYHEDPSALGELWAYGSEAPEIESLGKADPDLAKPLHTGLTITGAQIVWAARHEMARTLDDALARRTRALFLNSAAALEAAPIAARLLASELGREEAWARQELAAFTRIADGYQMR